MPSEADDIKTIFENSEDNGDFETCNFALLPVKQEQIVGLTTTIR